MALETASASDGVKLAEDFTTVTYEEQDTDGVKLGDSAVATVDEALRTAADTVILSDTPVGTDAAAEEVSVSDGVKFSEDFTTKTYESQDTDTVILSDSATTDSTVPFGGVASDVVLLGENFDLEVH